MELLSPMVGEADKLKVDTRRLLIEVQVHLILLRMVVVMEVVLPLAVGAVRFLQVVVVVGGEVQLAVLVVAV